MPLLARIAWLVSGILDPRGPICLIWCSWGRRKPLAANGAGRHGIDAGEKRRCDGSRRTEAEIANKMKIYPVCKQITS